MIRAGATDAAKLAGPLASARSTGAAPQSSAGSREDCPTRRTVVAAGLAAPMLGGVGAALRPVPDPYVIQSGSFTTPRWPGRRVGWMLARPRLVRGLVVALHGMGGDSSDWFEGMGTVKELIGTGLAVVAVDGAAAYWHPRAAGPYAGTNTSGMVVSDLLPLMARRGLPTQRIGFLGLSMGGYGSLYIASLLGPNRVFGVATLAAALRTSGEGTYPERFDDAEDYRRNDVFRRAAVLRRIPIWLACGDRDEFRGGNEAFARAVPNAVKVFDEGGHEDWWFQSHLAPALRFLRDRATPRTSGGAVADGR